MDSSSNSQLKTNTLEIIKNYRVPDLQSLLEYARLSRHGQKRELFQRCKTLISSNLTPQLANKIHQINLTRLNAAKSSTPSRTYHNQYTKNHPIVLSTTPPTDILPLPNHIQYINLPFFDKIRTIECTNMPVDWNTFSPLRFTLTEIDVDYILKGLAKVFLRIAPTIIPERQTDVLPPYLFVQCNGQSVINNNISKTIASQAHSISFPTDFTDKIIPKLNIINTLNYFWLQSPVNMSFKNLPKSYTLTIQLVRCVSLENLFENILKREPPPAQLTHGDNNDSDIEIEDLGLMATRHRVSLICPITQSLMIIPTKSSLCSHLTCFDLRPFLQMNERRVQWTCPLCKKSASYDTLHVDKRLQAIISNVPPNCSTVEIDSSTKILSDCQYILDNVKQEKIDVPITTVSHENDDEQSIHDLSIKSRHQSIESECIVLSSGSESEDENEIDDDNNTKSNDSPVPVTSLSIDLFNQISDIDERQINTTTSQSSSSINSLPSPATSIVDDGNYWDDIARITGDLITDNNLNRKRSNSSTSSLLSDDDDDHHHHHHRRRKRTKRPSPVKSRTADIEIITLSSSDSSDIDDQLS